MFDVFTVLHAINVDLEVDVIASDDGSDLLAGQEVVEAMAPAAPRGAEVEEQLLIFRDGTSECGTKDFGACLVPGRPTW